MCIRPTVLLRQAARDARGATAVEFALIFPVFLAIILGLMELGLMAYTGVALESIVTRAGREASIGQLDGTGTRAEQVEQMIRDRSTRLIGDENMQINTRVLDVGDTGGYNTGQGTPDICYNPYGVGVPVCNGQYEDVNGNGVYDPDTTTNDAGAASEVVEVNVRLPWRANFGFVKNIFGDDGIGLLTAGTIVKNEPFDN